MSKENGPKKIAPEELHPALNESMPLPEEHFEDLSTMTVEAMEDELRGLQVEMQMLRGGQNQNRPGVVAHTNLVRLQYEYRIATLIDLIEAKRKQQN